VSHFGFIMMVMTLLLVSASEGAEVPSSTRSRGVVDRVEPRLKGELQKLGLTNGSPVFIRIFKEPAKLELWMEKGPKYRLFRTYDICKFSGGFGPKLKEGDGQAPEGCYTVAARQMNPNSSYHLSFNLGFPNEFDQHHRRTGSALMVHGKCASIGCYAMGDEAIEEIWTLCVGALEKGQGSFPVHCFPFPVTASNLKRHEANEWIEFWKELEPVYSMFEKTRVPPRVVVRQGKYEVEAARLRVER
jgi:murein L,D-transpeptidase YafK